ncbi:hypothetical protein ACIRBX_23795 [Kitasatospora sp. NPDC096147]|uniref:hypothetical protein n=1 Tax=Kitasatospora sp. NPDC096147 TaxID=3364093 RepID=UPI003805FB65
MTGTEKKLLVGLALVAGLMVVIVGLQAGWPVWMWAVPAGVVLLLVILIGSTRPEPRGITPVSDGPPWEETRVDDVALPSCVPDYDFRFSALVWWRPIPNSSGLIHADPAGLAIETVLNRARELTERELPERADLVAHRLNGLLGTQVHDPKQLVEAMGGRVELRLRDDDRSRLGKLSAVRKSEEVWEHERRFEQSKRAYLGNDVLKTPGSALVWWMAQHDDQVREAVDLIGPLAQLSAVANDEAVSELYRHLVEPPGGRGPRGDGGSDGSGAGEPRVIGPLNRFLDDVDVEQDSPERTVWAHRMAQFTDAMDRPEAADLIREEMLGEYGGPVEARATDREPVGEGS